jgi:hypothetical protein
MHAGLSFGSRLSGVIGRQLEADSPFGNAELQV